MKLQLIKEISYSGTEISWNIWTTRDNGDKISCLSCHHTREDGEAEFNKRSEELIKIPKDFKPEVLKEITLV